MSSEKQETAKADLVRRLDPQALIEQAIAKESGIEVLERLFALAKDVRAEQAREKWNEAMAEFQKSAPQILKTKTADQGGRFTYKYAPLDEIMPKILPVLGPLGLSVSWRNRSEPGMRIATCRISHELGHFEESGEVAMPVGTDKMGASDCQRVGIAMTYARRYALMFILGIAPEDDPDAAEEPEALKMPRRKSDPAPQAEKPVRSEIRGVVDIVTKRPGKTGDREWILYSIKLKSGEEFKTFSEGDASFAKEAGQAPVVIEYEPDPKGGNRLVNISPPF